MLSRTLGSLGRSFLKVNTSGFCTKVISKVPQTPITMTIDESNLPPTTRIDKKTIQLLERLSLVDFANADGIARLEAAIRVADHLLVVNTDGVQPMITVLENTSLRLDEDIVEDNNMKDSLLRCADETVEDYFVVAPGNINFVPDEGYYDKLKQGPTQKD